MPFFKKTHPELGVIRPRIRLQTSYSEDEVFALLEKNSASDTSVIGKRVLEQYFLDIPVEYRHYWSPELKISCDEEWLEEGTLIRCLIGPRQSVWLMFVFIYTLLGVISLFGGMYGMVQLSLGKPSVWVWCFPITALIIVGVYVTAQMGQAKAHDQTMHLLNVFFESVKDGDIVRL